MERWILSLVETLWLMHFFHHMVGMFTWMKKDAGLPDHIFWRSVCFSSSKWISLNIRPTRKPSKHKHPVNLFSCSIHATFPRFLSMNWGTPLVFVTQRSLIQSWMLSTMAWGTLNFSQMISSESKRTMARAQELELSELWLKSLWGARQGKLYQL